MSALDKQTVEMLIKLSRIGCTEEEKNALALDLKNILSYVEQLQEIDTENVPPCSNVLENFHNVMREDEVGHILPRDLFLGNAPSHVGGMIRVPPVIKSN
jgi:aspartyl-tRNA(Asn)/glutamyl-tRNA(Gln) amidotransferase subunit C